MAKNPKDTNDFAVNPTVKSVIAPEKVRGKINDAALSRITKKYQHQLVSVNSKPERMIITMKGGKITLYTQPESKNWFYEIKIDGEEKTIRKTCKTDDDCDAREYAKEAFYELLIMKKHGHSISVWRFDKTAKAFLDDCSQNTKAGQLSEPMQKVYTVGVKALMGFFGKYDINKINEDAWRSYLVSVSESKYSLATLQHIRMTLKNVLKFAKRKKYFKVDIDEMKLPKKDVTSRRPHFTIEEWSSLERFMDDYIDASIRPSIKWSRIYLKLYCLIMINTGMRTNDALLLRWCDITDIKIKGQPFLKLFVKGKKIRRELISNHEVKGYFEQLANHYGTIKSTDLVFKASDGSAYNPLAVFKRMLIAANMLKDNEGTDRTPYSMRHSYATWKLEQGLPIHILALQMGTSINMIQQHYSHVTVRDHAASIAESFNIKYQGLLELPVPEVDEDDSE